MFDINMGPDNVIHLYGKLDASQVDKAKEVFKNIDSPYIVDFENLEYISSVGIGALLEVYQRLNQQGKKLKLINMNKNISNVFYYAGFSRIFDFER